MLFRVGERASNPHFFMTLMMPMRPRPFGFPAGFTRPRHDEIIVLHSLGRVGIFTGKFHQLFFFVGCEGTDFGLFQHHAQDHCHRAVDTLFPTFYFILDRKTGRARLLGCMGWAHGILLTAYPFFTFHIRKWRFMGGHSYCSDICLLHLGTFLPPKC